MYSLKKKGPFNVFSRVLCETQNAVKRTCEVTWNYTWGFIYWTSFTHISNVCARQPIAFSRQLTSKRSSFPRVLVLVLVCTEFLSNWNIDQMHLLDDFDDVIGQNEMVACFTTGDWCCLDEKHFETTWCWNVLWKFTWVTWLVEEQQS